MMYTRILISLWTVAESLQSICIVWGQEDVFHALKENITICRHALQQSEMRVVLLPDLCSHEEKTEGYL